MTTSARNLIRFKQVLINILLTEQQKLNLLLHLKFLLAFRRPIFGGRVPSSIRGNVLGTVWIPQFPSHDIPPSAKVFTFRAHASISASIRYITSRARMLFCCFWPYASQAARLIWSCGKMEHPERWIAAICCLWMVSSVGGETGSFDGGD